MSWKGHLAVGLVRLIDTDAYGIHHMAGGGSCSWYEFAMEIFRQAEVVTRVMASTTDMMERPAKRPAYSVLASGRSAPIRLPDWKRGLADYLARREQPEDEERPRRTSATRRQPVLESWRSEDEDDQPPQWSEPSDEEQEPSGEPSEEHEEESA